MGGLEMNKVVLIGRLAKDPDLRISPSGVNVCKFILAVDKDLYGEKKQEAINAGRPTADFITVTTFNKQAENAANYLTKGSKCAVSGRISTSSSTDQEGNRRYFTEVTADKVEFIEPKKQDNASGAAANFFDGVEDDGEIFQPVDEEEIPF